MAKRRDDGDREEPTLELPALFGRGKKRGREGPADPEPEPQAAPAAEPEPAPAAQAQAAPAAEPEPARMAEPHAAPVAVDEPEPRRRAEKPRRTGPVLAATVAAVLTGLVVGLLGTALTAAGLRGCDAVRGTDSCGGPGLGLLVAVVAVMVVAGAVLLKLLGVSEHRGTSFLGTGLMCVVVLVTLMEQLFSAWMFVVVPLICAVTYLVAQWVTTRFVEIDTDDRPHVDVR